MDILFDIFFILFCSELSDFLSTNLTLFLKLKKNVLPLIALISLFFLLFPIKYLVLSVLFSFFDLILSGNLGKDSSLLFSSFLELFLL